MVKWISIYNVSVINIQIYFYHVHAWKERITAVSGNCRSCLYNLWSNDRTMDLIQNDIKREKSVAVGISPGRTSKSVKSRTSRSQFEEIPFYKDESTGITYRPSGTSVTLYHSIHYDYLACHLAT